MPDKRLRVERPESAELDIPDELMEQLERAEKKHPGPKARQWTPEEDYIILHYRERLTMEQLREALKQVPIKGRTANGSTILRRYRELTGELS